MHPRQRRRNRHPEIKSLIDRQSLTQQSIAQRSTLEEFDDEKGRSAPALCAMYHRQVWVCDKRHCPRLASHPTRRVRGEPRQGLYSHSAIEGKVPGAVNNPHPATTQDAFELELAKNNQRQCGGGELTATSGACRGTRTLNNPAQPTFRRRFVAQIMLCFRWSALYQAPRCRVLDRQRRGCRKANCKELIFTREGGVTRLAAQEQ
jgi:hypothetical protein